MKEIIFSKRACNDGYDFSSLSKEKQILTKSLYKSFDMIDHLYDAYINIQSGEYKNIQYDQTEAWHFDQGFYAGFIFDVNKKVIREQDNYFLSLTLDADTIKKIKFTKRFDDPVYKSIKKVYQIKSTDRFDMNECTGKPIFFTIRNTYTAYDTPFSVVNTAKILSDLEEETIYDMFRLMIKQSNKG